MAAIPWRSGFTLVEVLVALLVLAVGMLATAALLIDSLRGSRHAQERTQAVNLATDIAERMRANRAAVDAYDTAAGTPEPRLEPDCERAGGTCDPRTMAGHDLRRWLDAVAAALPEATGSVAVEPQANALLRCTISVTWTQGGGDGPAAYRLAMVL